MIQRRSIALISLVLSATACTEPEPEVPPVQLNESAFHYPEDLWDAGVEGETVLEIHVSAAGTVDSARVGETSGYEQFDSAAIAGANDLRFVPARRGSDSVAVRVLLPIQFHLPAEDSAASETSGGEP
ncbi:MAG: TonB family protein [Gemmatimonas sp.]|nr:TonB family protein [Gemmatimonas sp.]